MTTATLPQQTGLSAAKPAIPMVRLVEIELRKMVDTRAGRWMLIGIAGLVALVLGIVIATASDPGARSFSNLAQVAAFPVSILLPVLGVLAATSEWTQRTVLPTFSLVPARGRNLAAKVIASLVLATVATVVAFALGAVATILAPIAGDVQQDWSLGFGQGFEILVYQWLCMLLGVALGTAFLNSALAIVLYFALPTIWSGISGAFSALRDAQPWLDTGTSWIQLLSDGTLSGDWWAKIATTSLLWIALPFAVGTWRVLRREVD